MNSNPITQRRLAEEAEAKRLAALREKCREDVVALRLTAKNILRSRLPGAMLINSVDVPNQYSEFGHNYVLKISAGDATYCFEFCVKPVGSYRTVGYRVEVYGDRYDRNGRSYQPDYKMPKSGAFPFLRMAEDAERAIARRREINERAALRATTAEQSKASFDAIVAATGATPMWTSAAKVDLGLFAVQIEHGDYSFGKVKLTLTLAGPDGSYKDAEAAIALIERLRGL